MIELERYGNYIFSLGLNESEGEDRGRVRRVYRGKWIIPFSNSYCTFPIYNASFMIQNWVSRGIFATIYLVCGVDEKPLRWWG